MVFKGCFHVGAYLCSLLVSSIFGTRAVFSMDACHVFPKGLLAFVPLIEGVRLVLW